MKSIVAMTTEIDDLDLAAKTLITQVKEKITLRAESVGIVYCDADMDITMLGDLLHKGLGIDIVGLTATAVVEKDTGYTDMGIILCVLTADDVHISIGCAEDLHADTYAAAIKNAYAQARGRLVEGPRLIVTLSPYTPDLSSENYMQVLDEASNGVPVFGGVASDHYDLQYQKTFLNGRSFERGLVFLLFAGNIKPLFAMEHHFGGKVEKKGVITQSEGSSILKVGDKTFKDFVSAIVPVPDVELVVYHFQSTPFIMELPDFEKGEQPVVRALCTVDHETGAGGFLSTMPEGSTIYLNVLQRDNLSESCGASLTRVISHMADTSDYEYSMLFIVSCNARHLLMGDVKTMESDIIQEKLRALPSAINAAGYYGFGEICPTAIRADGRAKNRYHNVSFAVCAI